MKHHLKLHVTGKSDTCTCAGLLKQCMARQAPVAHAEPWQPCKPADLQVEDQQQGELQAQRTDSGAGGGPEAVQQVGKALRQPGALAAAAPMP